MPRLELELYGRIDNAFGFTAKNVSGRFVRPNLYGFQQQEEDIENRADVYFEYTNSFGQKVNLDFTLKPFLAKTRTSFHLPFEKAKLQNGYNNIIAPPPMIEFSRSKSLVISPLNADGQEVVERYNTNPYIINIRGIVVDMENHHYPSEQEEKLHQLFDHNNPIKVIGIRFSTKEIDYIIASNFKVSAVEGYEDTIKYSFTARSVKEVNYTLNNPI